MKQPNWKTPLLLSALLAVSGTFAYWLIYAHQPKEEKMATAAKKPLALPAEDAQIATFRIKSTQGLIEGKCEDLAQKKCDMKTAGNWTITYPQTLKADSENIKSLLSSLGGATATETIDLSQETPEKKKQLMDEYGLSDAKRTDLNAQFVEFTLADGKKIAAWFGIQHPLGDKTFVAASTNGTVNDNTIFLVSNFYKSNFDHDLTWFRDKTLFTFDRNSIDSFEATTPIGKLNGKRENGVWTINGFKADYERLETVLSSIAQLKAKDFPADDPTHGLQPLITYDLHAGKETQHFSLFEKTIKLVKASVKQKRDGVDEIHDYLKTSARPELIEVDLNFKTQIDKKLSDLRDGLLLSQTEKATASQAEIAGKKYKSALNLNYTGGQWNQKGGETKIDPKRFASLLDLLSSTRVKDFVAPPTGAVTDEITLSIGDDKNPSKFKFKIYEIKNQLFAKDLNNNLKEVFALNDSLKSALPFDEAAWKMK